MEDKLGRKQVGPVVVDVSFLKALDHVVEGHNFATVALKETLDQAPRDVQHDLGVSLQAIQEAQDRVRAALESAQPTDPGDGR